MAADAREPAEDVRDVAPEDAAIGVDLVEDDEPVAVELERLQALDDVGPGGRGGGLPDPAGSLSRGGDSRFAASP